MSRCNSTSVWGKSVACLALALAGPTNLWAQTPRATDPNNAFKAYEQLAKDPQALEKLRQQSADRRAKRVQADHVAMPPRNEARLSHMPRQLLTPAQLPAYLGSIHAKVLQGLSPQQRSAAASLIAQVRSGAPPASGGAVALAQAGTLAWVLRQGVAGAVLLGQAAAEAPSNKQTISNYAATLTTLGVADLGIPLLLRLDADAPNNSTVLNNLGQAWFSLGAVDEAKKALKRAVVAFPRHAQANETLSHILESEGDAAGAGDALERSIDGGYSEQKVARLKRTGRTLPRIRIGGHIPVPDDPLGLGRFEAPEFCGSVADLKACRERIRLHVIAVEAAIAQIDKQLEELAAKPAYEPDTPPRPGERIRILPLAAAASARQKSLDEEFAKRPVFGFPAFAELLDRMVQAAIPINDAFGKQSIHDPCGATNASLAYNNAALSAFFATTRPVTQRYITESAYLNQFTDAPPLEAKARLIAKRSFLTFFAGVHGSGDSLGCDNVPSQPPQRLKPLADFYDLHCPNIITFTVPAIGDWTVRCNKMITHLNVTLPEMGALAGVSLRGSMTENLETGVVEHGSVEVGVSVGVGSGSAGPLAGEVDVNGAVGVTFGNGGVTDVVVRGGVQTTATNLGELPVVDSAAGVTVSVNSGVTVSAPSGSVLNIPVGDAP
jgi:tetratricopeptide (TPR) repeat protein